jgi:hypothetical protein
LKSQQEMEFITIDHTKPMLNLMSTVPNNILNDESNSAHPDIVNIQVLSQIGDKSLPDLKNQLTTTATTTNATVSKTLQNIEQVT